MRDFLPADKARRERVLAVIRQRYRAHGFDEIETPVVEDYERLHAGIGGDNEKLAYNVLRHAHHLGLGKKLRAILSTHETAQRLHLLGRRSDTILKIMVPALLQCSLRLRGEV